MTQLSTDQMKAKNLLQLSIFYREIPAILMKKTKKTKKRERSKFWTNFKPRTQEVERT